MHFFPLFLCFITIFYLSPLSYRSIPLKVNDVPGSLDGLIALRRNHSWQDAYKLSSMLMNAPNVRNLLTVQDKEHITRIRFETLFRLKLYDELIVELTQELSILESDTGGLTDRAFNCLHSYRLLLQEVRLVTGHGHGALESLLQLQHSLKRTSTPSVWTTYWRWQTHLHIINAHIRLRAWPRGLLELRKLQKEVHGESGHGSPSGSNSATTPRSRLLHEEEKCDLLAAQIIVSCRIVKLLLQMGALTQAQQEYTTITGYLAFGSDAGASSSSGSGGLLAQYPSLQGDLYLQSLLLLTQGLLQYAEEKVREVKLFAHYLRMCLLMRSL